MTKPTITIRQATLEDQERLAEFKISQYKTSETFNILDETPLHSFGNNVLIGELEDKIVTTMQFDTVNSWTDLSAKCKGYLPNDFTLFDTYYLGKGATIKDLRNSGLNSILRMAVLKSAIENKAIKSLTGTVYENSSRLNTLKKIGYNFNESYATDDNFFLRPSDKARLIFLYLSSEYFESAYEILKTETIPLNQKFNIEII